MLLLNPLKDGLTPKSVETLYNLVVVKNMVLSAKLDRIKKELSVAACAVEDKVIVDFDKIRNGMLNLIAYIEAKTNIEDELNPDNGSITIVKKHIELIKKHYEQRIENSKTKNCT